MTSNVRPRYDGIPLFVYGTAFKGDQNALLVEKALRQGFVGIDTASSTKAYDEKLTGEGIRKVLFEGTLKREEIYIQTKFAPFREGKDPKYFPQDTTADLGTQVQQSIENSLRNLNTSMIDGKPSYLDNLTLHEPYPTIEDTITVWKAFEKYVPHQIATLGISDTHLPTLQILYEKAIIKPVVVQNRFTQDIDQNLPAFTPMAAYDTPVRQFCQKHGIVYQPWGTLWGTPILLESKLIEKLGGEVGVTKEMALYLAVLGLGKVSMLNGTTNEDRMKDAHNGLRKFKEWRACDGNETKWVDFMKDFHKLIGQEL